METKFPTAGALSIVWTVPHVLPVRWAYLRDCELASYQTW
jgi:hypothetical protein